MNGLPVGSLVKTFNDHGRAKLTFKNCNDHGFVKVFINDKPIQMTRTDDTAFNNFEKSVGKNKMDSNFLVRPGDVLTLKEEEGAAIKVFSLTVGRGKKFLYRMNYDEYIFSSDLFFVFILLKMFYLTQLGARYDISLDFPSKEFELGAESLGISIDDSDNDDSNQELTSELMSYENIDKKSRAGMCYI